MNKPNFRPIAPLDADDSELERVNERLGVPTMVRTSTKTRQQAVVTASRQPVTPPRRQQKLTVRIPGYLDAAASPRSFATRAQVHQWTLILLSTARLCHRRVRRRADHGRRAR